MCPRQKEIVLRLYLRKINVIHQQVGNAFCWQNLAPLSHCRVTVVLVFPFIFVLFTY